MLLNLQLLIVMMQPVMYETVQYSALLNCDGHILPAANNYKVLETKSRLMCAAYCDKESKCASFQVGLRTCYLNNAGSNRSCHGMIADASFKYYQKKQPSCQHDGVMVANACQCINGYVGTYCERLMHDCSEGYTSPQAYRTSRVYEIHPNTSALPLTVYCEMKSGGRTFFQYHAKSSFYFNKTWTEYKDGFGGLTADHWLGLDKMHLITTSGSFRMVVNMKLKNGSSYHQYYHHFVVRDEDDKFSMDFSVTSPHSTLTLGDSLSDLRGMPFSTYDKDHDNNIGGNCASDRRSGWWYNNCSSCNFNGELLKPTDSIRTVDYEAFWKNDLQEAVPIKTRMWVTYL